MDQHLNDSFSLATSAFQVSKTTVTKMEDSDSKKGGHWKGVPSTSVLKVVVTTAQSPDDPICKHVRFAVSFGLNAGRFNAVHNLDAADRHGVVVQPKHKHVFDNCRKVWEAWLSEVGSDVHAESGHIMYKLRVTQMLVAHSWLCGVLLTSIGAAIGQRLVLAVGLLCFIIWAVSALLSLLWLQPAMDHWYAVFKRRVADGIDAKLQEWVASLGPRYFEVNYSKQTRAGRCLREDRRQWAPGCVGKCFALWLQLLSCGGRGPGLVLVAVVYFCNFCWLRCEPAEIDHYRIEGSYRVAVPSPVRKDKAATGASVGRSLQRRVVVDSAADDVETDARQMAAAISAMTPAQKQRMLALMKSVDTNDCDSESVHDAI